MLRDYQQTICERTLRSLKRHRSVIAWVLLSILATPILMIIILLVIGQNEDYNTQSYTEE